MAGQFNAGTSDDDRSSSEEHWAEVVPLDRTASGLVAGPGHRPPAFWSSFVGRTPEVEEVVTLLGSARLVTLTGPGGIGKTRLAVQVADRVAPGQAFFVDLAPLREAALVSEEIAVAVAADGLRDHSLAEVLAEKLGSGALLVLDNCEHLIEECAELAHGLLEACRGLQILATSQQHLGIPGEVVWPVPPLALPEPGPGVVDEAAPQAAAVQLFCQRAAAVNRTFVASVANLDAIVEICRQLEGNPLAIELAAARVDVLSPVEIAARLEGRFDVLRRQPGGGPARHETLAAALEWSCELLREPERVLLRRLSVFAGGFGLLAAEEVCAGGQIKHPKVLDLLSPLVARSLVTADTSGAVTRYRLLETVRHFAADALAAAGEAAKTGERHARWCLQLVQQGAEAEDEGAETEAMGTEQDNVRTALEWCLAKGRTELAFRLAAGQMHFWQSRGHFTEAREWLSRVLAAGQSAPAGLRAAALHDAGFAAFMSGDFDSARHDILASLELWAEAGDAAGAERTQGLWGFVSTFAGGPDDIEDLEKDLDATRAAGADDRSAEALIACGHARLFRGELLFAARHFEELVAVAHRMGNDPLAATGLVGAGAAALGLGDYEQAQHQLSRGVGLAAGPAEVHTRAVGTAWLGELARSLGDLGQARCLSEESLSQARALEAPYPLAKALFGLARVLLDQGEPQAALALFDEAVVVAGDAGLAHLVAGAIDGTGEVAVVLGDAASARARFANALALARECCDYGVVARSTYHLAELSRAEDALTESARLHHEALSRRHELGHRAGVTDSLEAVAGLAVAAGNYEGAARLFGAAEGLRETVGCVRSPPRRESYGSDVAVLREGMAREKREQAWVKGKAAAYDKAVAYATRGRGCRVRATQGLESLTSAQREIVALLAEGLTNPEIAEQLFISPRTVQAHLRSVYAKLHLTSRRQLRDLMTAEP